MSVRFVIGDSHMSFGPFITSAAEMKDLDVTPFVGVIYFPWTRCVPIGRAFGHHYRTASMEVSITVNLPSG